MSTRITRAHRVIAALALSVAGLPLTAGAADASQGGADDHKVTLCHRTNSENNPYVVITIDKAGVFKTGHDGHNEGGVYQPGDKANGVRWGDIIPPFDYYASPQDQRAGSISHYEGLNYTADGQAMLANGCQVPATEEQPPPTTTPPSGGFTTECTASGAGVDIGALNNGTSTGGRFVLSINGNKQNVSSGQQDIAVAAGAALVLSYVNGGTTSALQSGTAPAACPTSTTTTEESTPTTTVESTTTTTEESAVLPETEVKGVKVGRRPGGAKPGAEAPSEASVLGTEAGTLPHTGASTSLLLGLAVLLLAAGAGLVAGSSLIGRARLPLR